MAQQRASFMQSAMNKAADGSRQNKVKMILLQRGPVWFFILFFLFVQYGRMGTREAKCATVETEQGGQVQASAKS